MIQTKQLYLSPTTETLVVQVEESILITSDSQNNPNKGYESGWDLGDI